MTVAWSFKLAGAATSALSTSAWDAPGSSGGGGGGGSPRRCASTLVVTIRTAIATRTMRFMRASVAGDPCTSRPSASTTSARQTKAWTEETDEQRPHDESSHDPRRVEFELFRDPSRRGDVRGENLRNDQQAPR